MRQVVQAEAVEPCQRYHRFPVCPTASLDAGQRRDTEFGLVAHRAQRKTLCRASRQYRLADGSCTDQPGAVASGAGRGASAIWARRLYHGAVVSSSFIASVRLGYRMGSFNLVSFRVAQLYPLLQFIATVGTLPSWMKQYS